MTAVWEATALPLRAQGGEIPIVKANHSGPEHKQGKQCQVQVEGTKYPGGWTITTTKRNMACIWGAQAELSWQAAELNNVEKMHGHMALALSVQQGKSSSTCAFHTACFCSLPSWPLFASQTQLPNPCMSYKTFGVSKTDLSPCRTSLISVLACFVYAMDVLFFSYLVLFSFSETSFTVCVIQKRTETPQVQSRDCCSLCLHTSLWLIL